MIATMSHHDVYLIYFVPYDVVVDDASYYCGLDGHRDHQHLALANQDEHSCDHQHLGVAVLIAEDDVADAAVVMTIDSYFAVAVVETLIGEL